MRYRFLILMAFSLLFQFASASSLYPFANMKQEAQFNHLLRDLRCLVCQNQDLADSNAPLAKDLRAEVYELVKSGQSDSEIMSYLSSRYGDFILFNPPFKWITAVLWVGPLIFLLIGLLIFWRMANQSRCIKG